MKKKAQPYHSKKSTNVYHLFKDCSLGNNIDPGNAAKGKGGKRLCKKCGHEQAKHGDRGKRK